MIHDRHVLPITVISQYAKFLNIKFSLTLKNRKSQILKKKKVKL